MPTSRNRSLIRTAEIDLRGLTFREVRLFVRDFLLSPKYVYSDPALKRMTDADRQRRVEDFARFLQKERRRRKSSSVARAIFAAATTPKQRGWRKRAAEKASMSVATFDRCLELIKRE